MIAAHLLQASDRRGREERTNYTSRAPILRFTSSSVAAVSCEAQEKEKQVNEIQIE
jgi:hypothetical protein